MCQRDQERSGFVDAIAGGGASAGDIGDEKWGIFQSAHAEVGGLLLIPDAHQKVTGVDSLEDGRVD